MPADLLYTVKEAAILLRISPWSLRQKFRSGELRTTRLGPRQMRVAKADLDAFVASRASLPVSAPAAPVSRPNPPPGRRVAPSAPSAPPAP